MDLDLAIAQLAPTAAYLLTTDKSAILEWRGPGAQPTPQQLTDAWTAYQSAQAAKATDATTLRQAVQQALAGIPGTTWGNLTAAQRQNLQLAVLFKLGVLDKTLTVQPLSQWL